VSAPLRVVVADDELIVRRGVRMILEDAGVEVVAEAVDGDQVVQLVREHTPDVVLMDIRMPVRDGIEATRLVTAEGARVLVLTTYDTDENLAASMRAGASGFVLKTAHPEDLVHAVRVVARGDALLEPEISRRLIERFVVPTTQPSAWVERLTAREREVLAAMAQGWSNAEIGRELFLSEATVKTHVASVLGKIGVRDRLQAVVAAYRSGFVDPRAP
jgi:DNA-binding NarL/FixJ family response regulator